MMKELVLVIGGSDSSGGAGIQADIKSITVQGAYAASAITSITSQNTQGVQEIFDLPTDLIISQIDSVISDLDIKVVKIGMLNNIDLIRFISRELKTMQLVVDPVMVATSGDVLVSEEVIGIMKDVLFQNAEIITPNLAEAEVLSGVKINNEKDQLTAAKELLKLGSKHVLVKGGHLEGSIIKDILVANDYEEHFEHKKVSTENIHGTGCTLASSIAAKLAQDIPIKIAVKESIDFVLSLLSASPKVGKGNGPLVHGIKLN
tara:strand:+ start:102 stop:884 length:783 start_codon:yes stop_codon:yes gene_type:complete